MYSDTVCLTVIFICATIENGAAEQTPCPKSGLAWGFSRAGSGSGVGWNCLPVSFKSLGTGDNELAVETSTHLRKQSYLFASRNWKHSSVASSLAGMQGL